MTFAGILRLVWLNITQNRFKVILTSIGIIVGAATIVLVIAVGRGGQMDVADQFANLNAASIEVTTGGSQSAFGGSGGMMIVVSQRIGGGGGGGGQRPGGNMGAMPGGFFGFGPNLQTVNATLTVEDMEDIAFFVPDISQVTISVSGSKALLGGDMEEETNVTVAAVKPNYDTVSNLSMYFGDFITDADEESLTKSCVLGYNLAGSLFENIMDAYDSAVTIDGVTFTVVGVLGKMGTVSTGISPDEAVYIPYSSGVKYIFGRSVNPTITVVANSTGKVASVISNVEILLDENYPGASFNISDAGSKMEAAEQSSRTLSMLLLSIAIIVFVVGGIGIMNVLFVSVKERTGEIGVLKAIGMSKRDILLEFLLEATAISFVGGIAGVGASFAVMPIGEALGVRMEPVVWGYGVAVLFAVICGTMFGIYPAVSASRLIPVEALNHD